MSYEDLHKEISDYESGFNPQYLDFGKKARIIDLKLKLSILLELSRIRDVLTRMHARS